MNGIPCSTCKRKNATGRTDPNCHRTDEQIEIKLHGEKSIISPATKKDEYLLFFYWRQLPCGCWSKFDIQSQLGVDEDVWFQYCMGDGRRITDRLNMVAHLYQLTIDERNREIAVLA